MEVYSYANVATWSWQEGLEQVLELEVLAVLVTKLLCQALCLQELLPPCILLKVAQDGVLVEDRLDVVAAAALLDAIETLLGKRLKSPKGLTNLTSVWSRMPQRQRLELNCTANVKQLWSIGKSIF